jgi:tRNA 2-thiocytidine biosynthesis protein TtcA
VKLLLQRLSGRVERAVQDYGMISPGDRVLVGVSGGPDSLSLLSVLANGLVHAPEHEIVAAHVDMGFTGSGEWRKLEAHFRDLRVPYRIVHTRIGPIALDEKAKKNPCFICSMYRRKEIYKIAAGEKCSRIAYGHHQDDIIETLLINILYGRKIGAMHPVQELFGGKMHVIRPFVYVEEALLKRYAAEARLPVLPRLCPMDGNTRRQKVKELIRTLQKSESHADIRKNIFKALQHVELDWPRAKPGHEKPSKDGCEIPCVELSLFCDKQQTADSP